MVVRGVCDGYDDKCREENERDSHGMALIDSVPPTMSDYAFLGVAMLWASAGA
jgi:hypothetical protein